MVVYRLPMWTLLGRAETVERYRAEPSFVWRQTVLAKMGLEDDNDNYPMRSAGGRHHPLAAGKGVKGSSAPGRKRQATLPAEKAEAEEAREEDAPQPAPSPAAQAQAPQIDEVADAMEEEPAPNAVEEVRETQDADF